MWWIWIIVVAVVIILIAVLIGIRNNLVTLRNNVEEGWSTIDVYLKKRYDLIPNLVETVKGFAKQEKDVLEGVMKARYSAMNASGAEDKASAENMLTGTLKTLFSITENYPELRSNQNFLALQNDLKAIENELAQARKYYNAVVKAFNTKIEIFPDNIVAGMMKLKKSNYFELDNQEERKNVKVSFN